MKVRAVTAHHWGTGIAEVEDGALSRVLPHPDDPDPSPINDNVASSLAGRARVLRPAVRKSYLDDGPLARTGRRGDDTFVEVSWDRALDLVAAELERVRGTHGNGAIFAGSYGWASAGRLHHAQSQLKRFLSAAGGFVRSEGNYSYNAALVLMPYIVGHFREHLRRATRWKTVARHAELVVMFGGIPLRNTQVSGGGIAQHTMRDELTACANAGVRFVNLSPLRSDASESVHAEWLAPRPGSDTAVMLGMAHTLLVEGLHDQAFLDRYTVGFDRVAAYLLGEHDGTPKTAQWAATLSGLDAQRIAALAREMATQRSLLCTSVSLQRAEFGEQALWMTVTLASMIGQIGLAGRGYGIGYGADAAIGIVDRPFTWASFPPLPNPVADFIPVATVTDMLLKPGAPYPYRGSTRHYPDIRLVWWAGGNPFHHHQDLNRLSDAFQRPETIIVNELNWTATARHADIVLPVAAPLERTDFAAGNQDRALVPMPKVIEPPGEAREEYAIYRDLEARLSMGNRFSEGRSADEWLTALWDEMRSRPGGDVLPQLDAFLSGDVFSFDDPAPDDVFLADFRHDSESHALPTPSGRIELYCARIAGFGYEDCPGQATWLAPREWLGGELSKRFPLHLVSGQPATRLHSQLDNGATSMAEKIAGREPVLIHPDDAVARGISHGDVVELFNERGRCLAGAVVTDAVRREVVFLRTGAWFDPDATREDRRDRHGNPNVLTHDYRTSSLSQSPAAHSALVEMRRFEGELPQVTVFAPPPFVNSGVPSGHVDS